MLSYPGFTKVVICSGYFQESYNGSSYSILNDGILSTILANPNHCNIEYIIVGGKFNNATDPWKLSFNCFLSALKSNRINFKAYINPRGKWHAKISIGIEGNVPKTILLGSSNISRPAFGEPFADFNYEADIFLLANEPKLESHFNLNDTASQNPLSQIIAELRPEIKQANLEERIQSIANEFLEGGFLEEYFDFE